MDDVVANMALQQKFTTQVSGIQLIYEYTRKDGTIVTELQDPITQKQIKNGFQIQRPHADKGESVKIYGHYTTNEAFVVEKTRSNPGGVGELKKFAILPTTYGGLSNLTGQCEFESCLSISDKVMNSPQKPNKTKDCDTCPPDGTDLPKWPIPNITIQSIDFDLKLRGGVSNLLSTISQNPVESEPWVTTGAYNNGGGRSINVPSSYAGSSAQLFDLAGNPMLSSDGTPITATVLSNGQIDLSSTAADLQVGSIVVGGETLTVENSLTPGGVNYKIAGNTVNPHAFQLDPMRMGYNIGLQHSLGDNGISWFADYMRFSQDANKNGQTYTDKFDGIRMGLNYTIPNVLDERLNVGAGYTHLFSGNEGFTNEAGNPMTDMDGNPLAVKGGGLSLEAAFQVTDNVALKASYNIYNQSVGTHKARSQTLDVGAVISF
jgi:hypothetical protein